MDPPLVDVSAQHKIDERLDDCATFPPRAAIPMALVFMAATPILAVPFTHVVTLNTLADTGTTNFKEVLL
jgi:hypothetical protein